MYLFFFCHAVTLLVCVFVFFFFNDTATTEIYTLSLHDALPICVFAAANVAYGSGLVDSGGPEYLPGHTTANLSRSEEHTSELQSQSNLVCRLLLEKKKTDSRSTEISFSRSLNL